MAELPTNAPAAFVAGTTQKWRKTFPDYPSSAGWSLTYAFRSANGGAEASLDATAAADGSGFIVTIGASTTESLLAGTYFFRAFVEKSGEKYLVDSGETKIEATWVTDQQVDGRSQAKRILDAIDALIAGTATTNQKRYQINNRELERYPLTELIALRTHYANLVAREQQAERLRDGKGFFKTIHTRFTRPT